MASAPNKFWGGASSSSGSDSDDSSEDQPQVQAAQAAPRRQMARWAEESSSEEEQVQKRVVRSHTDKRYEQLMERIKLMKNHIKIDDFGTLITDYEAILKMLEKLRMVVEQDGGPPNGFIKAIYTVETYVEKTHVELTEKKQSKGEKLSENKQRAFNTLRAKVRKGNRQFEADLNRLKEHPEEFESEEEKAASGASDSESEKASSGSSSSGSDDSSDSSSDSDSDSNSGSDSDSSGSSSESDSYKTGGSDDSDDDADTEAAREKKMLRWLITPDKLAEREKKAAAARQKEEENKLKDQEKRDRKKKTDDGPKQERVAKKGEKEPEEYSPDELMKKVTEVAQQRGRRGFDRKQYMDKLSQLMVHAAKQGPRAQLYIYSSMVSADFDNTGSAFASMKIENWNEALDKVNKMLPLLVASFREMKENGADEVTLAAGGEGFADAEDPRSHARQQELFLAFVEKLDDELYKALQFMTDVYGTEYMEILGNCSKFLVLLKRTLKFMEDTKQKQHLGAISMRLMEQLYYKPDTLNSAVYEAIHFTMPDEEKPDWVWPEDSRAFIGKLTRYVYAAGIVRMQRRACLCQAYHLAMHDHFQVARDLLHLSNMQEQALEQDVHTQILYNRVLAQMGLCAFRLGKIQEAHNCLMDVCMGNKARELLAQGLSFSKNNDRTEEQEKAERLRQLPYHMHVNLEVLESAHHICAMLLEVPNLAMQSIDPNNKRIISRVLRRALDQYDKQPFTGPPENAKEAVVCAAKALQRGDWQSACSALEDLKIWDHIHPVVPENGTKIKEMIKEKIKTEALRTYLFAYSSIYDAFHLDQLVGMFDLPPKTVHSIVSKMMIKEEITAFWDESSKFVLVQHTEPSPLQRLALTLADRGAQAVENNERLVDQKTGGYGFKEQRPNQGQGRWEQDGGGRGKGRFGKGGAPQMDGKGGKGKGRGKGMATGTGGPPKNRGWENARAGAMRGSVGAGGTGQRGWATSAAPARPSA